MHKTKHKYIITIFNESTCNHYTKYTTLSSNPSITPRIHPAWYTTLANTAGTPSPQLTPQDMIPASTYAPPFSQTSGLPPDPLHESRPLTPPAHSKLSCIRNRLPRREFVCCSCTSQDRGSTSGIVTNRWMGSSWAGVRGVAPQPDSRQLLPRKFSPIAGRQMLATFGVDSFNGWLKIKMATSLYSEPE